MKDKTYTTKQIENKKEDKKAIGKYLLFILLGLLIGIACGAGIVVVGYMDVNIGNGVVQFLRMAGIFGGYALIVPLTVAVLWLYKKSRKLYATWDGEDEEVLERIEKWLSYASWLSGNMMIAAYLFLGTGAYAIGLADKEKFGESIKRSKTETLIYLVVVLGSMIIGLVASVVTSQLIVNMIKEINPEKKGSIYDSKFSEKWLDTCDEAEQGAIYRASYKTMRVTSQTCIITWLICLIGMLAFQFGLMPLIAVTVIWFVQTTTYSLTCIKGEKRSK